MSSEAQEALKEILFGGAFGLCSGIALKKLSLPFLAGASSALFFLFRAAIFGKNFKEMWNIYLYLGPQSFTLKAGYLSRHKLRFCI